MGIRLWSLKMINLIAAYAGLIGLCFIALILTCQALIIIVKGIMTWVLIISSSMFKEYYLKNTITRHDVTSWDTFFDFTSVSSHDLSIFSAIQIRYARRTITVKDCYIESAFNALDFKDTLKNKLYRKWSKYMQTYKNYREVAQYCEWLYTNPQFVIRKEK